MHAKPSRLVTLEVLRTHGSMWRPEWNAEMAHLRAQWEPRLWACPESCPYCKGESS